MRAYGIRIPVVLAAMAGALLLLFGVQFIYNRQAVEQPLVSIYHDVPAVQHVALQNTSDGLQVSISLGLVPNLASTYRTLEKQVASVVGSQHFRIQLTDKRTPELESDFYAMNGILEQGIATGQFVSMQQAVQAKGQSLGLTRASAIVDAHHVYVELVKGKHYLYALLPRQTGAPPTAQGGN